MFTNRVFSMLIIVAILIVTACTPQVAMPPTPGQDPPITLRFAVADGEGAPSQPYVQEFIDQAKGLSNGNIIIEPTWDAGSETEAGFETGVVQLVKEGKFDLGLAASRAFDNENITSFQALQAPFLIDNDALSKAVVMSDIATHMLEDLSSSSMVGLMMWPEDLRHPFSVTPGKPILAPEDFAGLTVRATPSQVTYELIKSMGGSPMLGDEYQAAESGLRQGASLNGTPTATGNVVFFAKFQVLFGNGPTLEKLSDGQRAILRQAALATQTKAIAEHPSDAEAAATWCADGGSVVLASAEQLATFQQAAQPIFDSIAKEKLNAEFITAIRDLKANTESSAGAEACNGVVVQSDLETGAEYQVWSAGLPPNGVWQVELGSDDFLRMGVNRAAAYDWVGTYTIRFQDGRSIEDFQGPARRTHCEADLEVVGDLVRETYTDSDPPQVCIGPVVVMEWQWRIDAEGLHLHLVSIEEAPFLENAAVLEAKPWQKAE